MDLRAEELTTDQLTLPRRKHVPLPVRLGYRLHSVLAKAVGHGRLLNFELDGAWLLHRLAWETALYIYGDDGGAMLRPGPELLGQWVEQDSRVLDVGCGVGSWSRAVAGVAQSVLGIDHNAEMIEEARRRTPQANVEYRVADVTDLKDIEGIATEFDICILSHIVEHVHEPLSVLKEVSKISRRLIISVPDFDSDRLNPIRWHRSRIWYSDADHVREFTLSTLKTTIGDAGLALLEHRRQGGSILALVERA